MPDFSAIKNLPDISFIDDRTVEDVRAELVADYEAYMTQMEGVPVTLARSSPHRGILYAAAAQIFQAMQYIDRAGKQSMLKDSYSGFLDNLAALKGVERAPAACATTTLRFTISAVRDTATGIPRGARVSASGSIYFATDEYAEIPSGETTVEVSATCTVSGTEGNDFTPGELSSLIDPIPYIESVENITRTEGGAEIESDEDLAERVYLAPSAYSTAGPEDAYIYHAKKFNTAIGDVVATSNQAAGMVNIVFIMADGSAPGEEMIENMRAYLQNKNVRPMTDLVTVGAPHEVQYTVEMTYYINRSDSARAATIQDEVKKAVAEYITWQRTIGRDINPSKLVAMAMAAGAKRVVVDSPTFQKVDATDVAGMDGDAVIRYGGLEDD